MLDKVELRKWWDIFVGDGNFTEVRILGKFQYSGYFKSFDNLCTQLEPYTQMDDEQIYFVLNQIDSSCYARPQCEKFLKSVKVSTNDNDIIRRKFLMIDCDAIRKSSTNSSESEYNAALQKARDIFRFLREKGFDDPIVCTSGNGAHLQIPVDLPNDEETTEIIKRFYKFLGSKFTDNQVDIDQKVYNLARLCKTYSTTAKKGANLPERPWRKAKILYIPKELKPTPIEKIKELADLAPKEEPKQAPNRPNRQFGNGNTPFDLRTWLNAHGIVYKEETNGDVTKFALEHCPWEDTHSNKQKWDSALFQNKDGQITFSCFHSHCRNKTWFDYRQFYEPDAYNKPAYQPQAYQRQYIPQAPQKPKYQIKEENPELGKKWLSMSDIEKVDLSAMERVKTGITEIDQKILGLTMTEVTLLSGGNGCVDCDTEYFNGVQWKKISDFTLGEKVLQYNIDGSAELVTPQRYIKSPCEELYLMQSITGVDQCVSLNHNLVYMTSKGNLAKKTMEDFMKLHYGTVKGFTGRFYTTFDYRSGKGMDLTNDEIRLMCAIICDGSFSNIYRDKSIVRINLKKERKKARLESLLKKCNIEYRKEQYTPKDLGYNTYLFHAPRKEKEFSSEWYSCTSEQLAIVADEIMYWDGYIPKGGGNSSYSSVSKKNIDFVQFAFASIGVRTHINIDNRIGKFHSNGKYQYKTICYGLSVCSTKYPSIVNPKQRKEILRYKPKDGYKYCFTVPSGMLVLRRNGNINITGNSGKSSLLNTLLCNFIQQGFKTALWSGELPAPILKTWIQMVAAGRRNLRPSNYGDGKYYVPNNVGERIDQWLDGKLFLFNNEYGAVWSEILHDMSELIKLGVKVFILDNLFSLDIDLLEGDKNNKQKELILQIKEFAKKNQVHVILVAHPRKSMAFLRKNDISGSADLTNAVDNVWICHRVNQDFFRSGADFYGQTEIQRFQGYGTVIEICKNRLFGAVDVLVGLQYEIESRRFKNEINENVQYGWEIQATQSTMPFVEQPQPQDPYYPFEQTSEEVAPF